MNSQPLLVSHGSAAAAAAHNQPGPAPAPLGMDLRARHAATAWHTALLAGFVALAWHPVPCLAQAPAGDEAVAQVLTRGPVHEAFAGIVTFNPEPGVVVPKTPPELIEEIPPAERPEGDNVAWIPGYWAWDDERSDFLWISGIWRALPPGRQWIAGYWGKTTEGYQWTSGYWADAAAQETTYLPPPPATVENGPNIAAPSRDYGWTPGTWIWRQERYAWQPGYWSLGRADWTWMPAHYVWTPRGYIFVDGYWDYAVARRGVVFAPVWFDEGVYLRPGYSYSPLIVIDLALFAEQLFLRPRYHHYYFGDYYAPGYHQGGYFAACAFQSNRFGYDPIYAHERWEHRQDRAWEKRVETTYQYRRDHENARPPRTWDALQGLDANAPESQHQRAVAATSIDQLAKRKGGPQRFQAMPQDDRKMLAQSSQEIRKSRDQRRMLETGGAEAPPRKPGAAIEPSTVKLPRSSIVAKSAGQLKKSEMPPATPRAPKAELKELPKPERTGRPADLDLRTPESAPRQTEVIPKKKLEPQPRPAEATPKKRLEPQPRQAEAIPQKRLEPQPRQAEEAPKKRLEPQPRQADIPPKKRQVLPEPRMPEVTPPKRQVQPEPSRRVEPPQRQAITPPKVVAPPAQGKPASRDSEVESSDKKDRNKAGQ